MTGIPIWVALKTNCLIELDGLAFVEEVIARDCLDLIILDVFCWPSVGHEGSLGLPGEFVGYGVVAAVDVG